MFASQNRRQFLFTLAGAAAVTGAARLNAFAAPRMLRFEAEIPAGNLPDRLPPAWYQRKVKQIQAELEVRKLDALLLLNNINIIYAIGYFHISTERPLAALIPKSGEPALFIPDLESDQVKLWWVKDYEAYFDFPGPVNRVRWIFERVAKRGLDHGRIGIEEATAGRLKQIKLGAPHATLVHAGDLIEHQRWVKDEDELRLMRRAMYFADF